MITATDIKPSAAEVLRMLAEKHGGSITPEIVLRSAKPKKSPLHDYFEWDDSEAAGKYRLVQAASLIRSIRVTYNVREDRVVRVRAYANVKEDRREDDEPTKTGIYVPIEKALTVQTYRDQLLLQCKRDMAAFRQKYAALEEVRGVIEAIDLVSQ